MLIAYFISFISVYLHDPLSEKCVSLFLKLGLHISSKLQIKKQTNKQTNKKQNKTKQNKTKTKQNKILNFDRLIWFKV